MVTLDELSRVIGRIEEAVQNNGKDIKKVEEQNAEAHKEIISTVNRIDKRQVVQDQQIEVLEEDVKELKGQSSLDGRTKNQINVNSFFVAISSIVHLIRAFFGV